MAEAFRPKADLKLSDKIAIELPVFVWHGFVAAYIHAEYLQNDATVISHAVIKAIADPLWVNETEAEYQAQADQNAAMQAHVLHSFLGGKGLIPGFPPSDDDA